MVAGGPAARPGKGPFGLGLCTVYYSVFASVYTLSTQEKLPWEIASDRRTLGVNRASPSRYVYSI